MRGISVLFSVSFLVSAAEAGEENGFTCEAVNYCAVVGTAANCRHIEEKWHLSWSEDGSRFTFKEMLRLEVKTFNALPQAGLSRVRGVAVGSRPYAPLNSFILYDNGWFTMMVPTTQAERGLSEPSLVVLTGPCVSLEIG